MPIRVGLIGLGKIGAFYDRSLDTCMTHVRAIKQNKSFSLSFAIDPYLAKGEVSNTVGDAFFPNLNDVPNDLRSVDLLVISSPTQTHASVIKKSVELTDCKRILCEKPLAATMIEVEEIASFCQKNSVDLKVNFMRRSLPSFQSVMENLGGKNLKTGYDVFIGYSGDFANNASHFIDLVLFWFSAEVKICAARYDKNGMLACDLEVGQALVCIRPNAVQSVSDHRVHISSELARMVFERAGRSCKYYRSTKDLDFPGYQNYEEYKTIKTDYTRFMSYVYRDIEDWIETGQSTILCSRMQAEYVSQIIEGVINVADPGNKRW